MKKRNIKNIIFFIIYTYLIANSLLFAAGIASLDRFTLDLLWKAFINIFCQWSIFYGLFGTSCSWGVIIGTILLILWDIAIFIYPVRLFWRKRTVYNAWLVALAGAFIPQYIMRYLHHPPAEIFYGLLIMTIGYVVAGVIERG